MSARSKKPSNVVSIRGAGGPSPTFAACVGTITSWSAENGLFVDYPGNTCGPRDAVSTVALTKEELDELVAERRAVVLALGEDGAPIVIGVVQAVPAARPAGRAAGERAERLEALVDGEEVTLEGKERVELRCGKASIVLTKAGKVLIQGTYISSRSSGAHRIRGGSVEVN